MAAETPVSAGQAARPVTESQAWSLPGVRLLVSGIVTTLAGIAVLLVNSFTNGGGILILLAIVILIGAEFDAEMEHQDRTRHDDGISQAHGSPSSNNGRYCRRSTRPLSSGSKARGPQDGSLSNASRKSEFRLSPSCSPGWRCARNPQRARCGIPFFNGLREVCNGQ